MAGLATKLLAATTLIACAVACLAVAPPPCRFATNFSSRQLLSDATTQARFLAATVHWEGKFQQAGVGYDAGCGVTVDGYALDDTTGTLTGSQWLWTSPAKESLHLGLLALAIDGNELALELVGGASPLAVAHAVLARKMQAFEQFNVSFPGYGGFLPWVLVNASGIVPAQNWESSVPGLDNGEFVWGLIAVAQALRKHSGPPGLLQRYEQYIALLARNVNCIFFQSPGWIRSVAVIGDTAAPPTPGNYKTQGGSQPYLDDPYEGELMCQFMYLYGNAPGSSGPHLSSSQQELLWVNKRAKLQAAQLATPSNGTIVAQRGWWFSAHEQWKYLLMPYRLSAINWRVFVNGERGRTWHSATTGVPGMYASVTNVTANGPTPSTWQYLSAAGVQPLAFETVLDRAVVTPYAVFPLMLATADWLNESAVSRASRVQQRGVAWAWYQTMLLAPRGQSMFGSVAAMSTSGDTVCPLLTWDSKATTVLAALGGTAHLAAAYMNATDGLLDKFTTVVDREWARVFEPVMQHGMLPGEDLPFHVPTAMIPRAVPDFTTCSV